MQLNFMRAVERAIKFLNSYKLPISIVLFVLIFQEKSKEIVSSLLIRPLLSSLTQSDPFIDAIIILVGVIITVILIYKAVKHVILSPLFIAYTMSCSFVYIAFRSLFSQSFTFVHFATKRLSSLYLLDVLLAPIIAIIIYYPIFWLIEKRIQKQLAKRKIENIRFYVDSPTILNKENDHQLRNPFIIDLKEKILLTESSKDAFSIGIIGRWGSGKTTFMNSLEQSFELEKDYIIQMRFNPWSSLIGENISTIFFTELSQKLSVFDDSLKYKVLSYSKELIQSVNKDFSLINTMTNFTFAEKSIREKFDYINDRIGKLKKKIVIYIDDVDRLHNNEIIEVLRIIRNNANFGNVFFIVAYDKSYVTNAIKTCPIPNAESYLEKIFQLEYYLPLYNTKGFFQSYLFTELKQFLDETDKTTLEDMINYQPRLINFDFLPPVESHINSFRDVNRFMNVFLLNYHRIKDNIYLPDYIAICILKLKYPELYQIIYNQKDTFLATYDKSGKRIDSLNIQLDDQKKSFKIEHFIVDNCDSLALDKNTAKVAANLIISIFDTESQYGALNNNRNFKKNYLSITNPSYFERYFDFSMDGRLHEKEFLEKLNGPLNELKKAIDAWNISLEMTTDLHIKFENYSEFDSLEKFEKTINAIAYFANSPNPQNPKYSNSYNHHDFRKKLGAYNDSKNKVIQTLYKTDFQTFEKFFRGLFDDSNPQWGFVQEFAVEMIKSYDNFIFSSEQLRTFLKENFLNILNRQVTVNSDILQFYSNLIRQFKNPNPGTDDTLEPIGEGIEITKLLKKKILVDIVPFLEWCIRINNGEGTYTFYNWSKVIFESNDNFDRMIDGVSSAKIDEFKQFYSKWKDNQKQPIAFVFQLLTPEID